jgi:hypothetical protein
MDINVLAVLPRHDWFINSLVTSPPTKSAAPDKYQDDAGRDSEPRGCGQTASQDNRALDCRNYVRSIRRRNFLAGRWKLVSPSKYAD